MKSPRCTKCGGREFELLGPVDKEGLVCDPNGRLWTLEGAVVGELSMGDQLVCTGCETTTTVKETK